MADLLELVGWARDVALQIAVEPRPTDLVEAPRPTLEAPRLGAVRSGLTADEASRAPPPCWSTCPAARTPG
ncbi:hypothetical protein ACGFS9_31825 [Streptomyces sp. NPDC048566]|uniref:hypothetical protein n=1 Tax=Streptomyces sp. NPDC048566 TaxID=3365569 RepID=UPI00371032FA